MTVLLLLLLFFFKTAHVHDHLALSMQTPSRNDRHACKCSEMGLNTLTALLALSNLGSTLFWLAAASGCQPGASLRVPLPVYG